MKLMLVAAAWVGTIIPGSSILAAETPSPALSGAKWRVLAPLPDPVGFGGMFAGVLNGRLLAGGGTQFRGKPLWLNGEKIYSDRIFALDSPGGKWQELTTRCPDKRGHFASAASAQAVYLIGGLGESGGQQSCYKLHLHGGDLVFDPLPDYPTPVCFGAAAIAGGRLWVTGGQRQPADKAAVGETWSLDLAAPHQWRREPNMLGPGIFLASAGSDGHDLFVFGGMAFAADGSYAPSNRAYRFDVATRAWERLPDIPETRLGAVSPCPFLPDGRLFLVGGYPAVFPGPPRDSPGFSAQTYFYDIAKRFWEAGPLIPKSPVGDRDAPGDAGPGPMVAAPAAIWANLVVVVSGEIRASIRTPAVIAWPILGPETRSK